LLYSRIDYSRPTVHRLIAERRLAPFYLGLQDLVLLRGRRVM
jgi:hypothetical protein